MRNFFYFQEALKVVSETQTRGREIFNVLSSWRHIEVTQYISIAIQLSDTNSYNIIIEVTFSYKSTVRTQTVSFFPHWFMSMLPCFIKLIIF